MEGCLLVLVFVDVHELCWVLNPQDADTYVHLHITLDYEEGKGWLLYATATIETGMVVIADAPYAIVPAVPPIATKP